MSAWAQMFERLGNPTRILSGQDKVKYHAACAVASNFVCALFDMSTRLLRQCGFDEKEALAALSPLALANVKRILEVGAKEALTGPVERGDIATIEKHLASITDDKQKALYLAATDILCDLAKVRHPDRNMGDLETLIAQAKKDEILTNSLGDVQ